MEYIDVVSALMKKSAKTEEEVENLLGYLFYEDEESCELAPIEQSDLVDALKESKDVAFSLVDGEQLASLSHVAAEEISLSKRESRKIFVRFIGDETVTVESAQVAFTPIEGAIQGSLACDVLLGVTVDPELGDQKIVVLVSFE